MGTKQDMRRLAMACVWAALLWHFSCLQVADVPVAPEAVGAEAEHRLLEERHSPRAGAGPGTEGGHPPGERERRGATAGQRSAHEAGEGRGEYRRDVHHHMATPVDLAISAMLLGCVVFIMMLFYLVNYNDEDIKFYSWSVISCTISIFSAIFLFDALDEVLDQVMRYKNMSPVHRAFLDYSVMLLCLLLLQLTIMANVGVICAKSTSDLALGKGKEEKKGADPVKTSPRQVSRQFSPRQRIELHSLEGHDQTMNTKTWAMLLSHMSGFASIFAAGTMQHLEPVREQPMLVLAIVPVHLFFMHSLFLLAAQFRRCFKHQHLHPATLHLWEEETKESENDVASLSLAFLLVQGLRFNFTGELPDRDGIEELPEVHRWQGTLELLLSGVAFAALTLGLVRAKPTCSGSCVYRLAQILEGLSSMAFAWSLFFTSKWELKRLMPEWDPNTMMPRTVLAISMSGGCCVLIIIFDMIVDLDETDETVDEAIKKIISGLALLVGFAWEQSFEGATHNLASVSDSPVTLKVALALAVVVIVVPAWKWYILVKVHKVEAMMTARRSICASRRMSQMSTMASTQMRPLVTRPKEVDVSGTSSMKCTPVYEALEQESTMRSDREDTGMSLREESGMSGSDAFTTPRPQFHLQLP